MLGKKTMRTVDLDMPRPMQVGIPRRNMELRTVGMWIKGQVGGWCNLLVDVFGISILKRRQDQAHRSSDSGSSKGYNSARDKFTHMHAWISRSDVVQA
jgi:hypothetical protein